MFKDDFKERYTTIPFAIYRARCEFMGGGVISHQHREIELIAMCEGAANFYVDGTLYKIEKGDVLIIPPYAIHRAETSDELTSYNCICFDLAMLWDKELVLGLTNHTQSVKHLISNDDTASHVIRECVERACVACEMEKSGWEMDAIGNMSLIFSALKGGGYVSEAEASRARNTFAQRVMDYISDNYSEQLTSTRVADALYMNNSYFCRLFKKTFGCCFSDYLLAYRLEKAKTLLINTNFSITEISFNTGFNSCSYFGKTFRERFSLSPLSYRKANVK